MSLTFLFQRPCLILKAGNLAWIVNEEITKIGIIWMNGSGVIATYFAISPAATVASSVTVMWTAEGVAFSTCWQQRKVCFGTWRAYYVHII